MVSMGFPPYVIRRCPVICFQRTTFTVELAELILTLMTSELGAGQISSVIAKRRTAFWAASARVYLEAQNHSVTLVSHKGSLSSFGFVRAPTNIVPFPPLTSHCGGFGGSQGPSSRNIQRFFVAMTTHLDLFADRFMMSLGGQVRLNNQQSRRKHFFLIEFYAVTRIPQVLSADHTFNIPARIKSSDIAGSSYSPIEGLHAG